MGAVPYRSPEDHGRLRADDGPPPGGAALHRTARPGADVRGARAQPGAAAGERVLRLRRRHRGCARRRSDHLAARNAAVGLHARQSRCRRRSRRCARRSASRPISRHSPKNGAPPTACAAPSRRACTWAKRCSASRGRAALERRVAFGDSVTPRAGHGEPRPRRRIRDVRGGDGRALGGEPRSRRRAAAAARTAAPLADPDLRRAGRRDGSTLRRRRRRGSPARARRADMRPRARSRGRR